jgi:hypothetical protein
MNKKVLLVGALAALTLAGCQNLEEQIGSKIAEGIINTASKGEVKVDFDDLQKGKINVTTKEGTISMSGDEDGGTLKMVDPSGKTIVDASGADGKFVVKDETGREVMSGDENKMTIKSDDGTSVYQSSPDGSRPSDVPADLPTVDGGKNFVYISANDSISLSYTLAGSDLKGNCDKQVEMLTGAGWTAPANSFTMETAETVSKSYEKGDNKLTVSCGVYNDQVQMSLMQSKKA